MLSPAPIDSNSQYPLLRIALDTTAVVSLMLCAANIALWVRSYRVVDQITRESTAGAVAVQASRGRLLFFSAADPDGPWMIVPDSPQTFRREEFPADAATTFDDCIDPSRAVTLIGFAYQPQTTVVMHQTFRYWACVVPLWFVAAVTFIGPALALHRRLTRRRRTLHGLCPTCGYDLRATPDRCPECGTILPT